MRVGVLEQTRVPRNPTFARQTRSPVKIGVLSANLGKANLVPFRHLLQIVDEISEAPVVIEVRNEDAMSLPYIPMGDNHLLLVHKVRPTPVARTLSFVATQITIARLILRLSKDVDVWIFYQGQLSLLSILAAKI